MRLRNILLTSFKISFLFAFYFFFLIRLICQKIRQFLSISFKQKCCDEDSKVLRILNKHSLTSTIPDCKSFQQHVVHSVQLQRDGDGGVHEAARLHGVHLSAGARGARSSPLETSGREEVRALPLLPPHLHGRVQDGDISQGREKYPIQAVNEVDQEEFIMNFQYITQNLYASNVTVTSTVDMQKCYCKDNCSSSDCTCTHINKCWYDMDGCLLPDFYMNFDVYNPPSLYECNKTCHCPETCINRVVQKGLRFPLQLFRTLNKGWGVRTLKDLARGTFVCEYVGEVISDDEIYRRTDNPYLLDLQSKTGLNCIDGRSYGNISRFFNHSCEPNLVCIQVFTEHQDSNFPRIAFFTTKDIKAFEELCFDYGSEFWLADSKQVSCTCNSSSCKYSEDSIIFTYIACIKAYIRASKLKKEEAFSPMDVQLS